MAVRNESPKRVVRKTSATKAAGKKGPTKTGAKKGSAKTGSEQGPLMTAFLAILSVIWGIFKWIFVFFAALIRGLLGR